MKCRAMASLRLVQYTLFAILICWGAKSATAAVSLDLEFISWHVIGLDSNNVNAGPNEFPAGVRVTNTGDTAATNVCADFNWDLGGTGDANIYLKSGTLQSICIPELGPGEYQDFYWNIEVLRAGSSYGKTRRFHVDASADGVTTLSTPTPREFYVENLISQNRNSVIELVGPNQVLVGQIRQFILRSETSSEFPQLTTYINFPNQYFLVLDTAVQYDVPSGPTNDKIYADGCGWDDNPLSPYYMSCDNPAIPDGFPGGKVGGGEIVTLYTVLVLQNIGEDIALHPLILDMSGGSGGSFHYNTDFPLTLTVEETPEVDLTVVKTANDDPVTAGLSFNYTLTAINLGPDAANDVILTDTLPAELQYVTAVPAPTTLSPLTWALGDLYTTQTKSITLTVTADCPSSGPAINTLTIGMEADTGIQETNPANNTTTELVTIIDPPPTIACPSNIVASADPGLCSAVVSYTVTPLDNCVGVSIVSSPPSGSAFPVGVTDVVSTATDGLGQTATCTFTVTVTDDEDPAIQCPANVSVTADPGACERSDPGIGTPTVSDNCGTPSVSGVRSDGQPIASPYPVGTTTITWTATDSASNTATCLQTVVVNDLQPPSITCPANVSSSTDPGECSAGDVEVGTPSVNDNCGPATVNGVRSDGQPLAADYPLGTTTITWTATDSASNTATCLQTVVVADGEDPAITCPPDVSVNADPQTCEADAVTLGNPVVTDNCAGVTVNGARSDSLALNAPYPVGTTTVTWTATDGAGNTATCSQLVTVTDIEDPSIVCPPTVDVFTDANTCSSADVALGTPETNDNCGTNSLSAVRSDAQPLDAPYPLGTTTVTWTITDDGGNSTACTQLVVVTDAEDPILTCPLAVAVNTDPGLCSASNVSLGTPEASDNCTTVTVAGVRSDAQPLGDPYPKGTTTITWTATDYSGNSATCQQAVVVTDNEDPLIDCPTNVSQNTDPGQCEADSVSVGTPTVTDNCSGASADGVRSDALALNAPYPVGTTTITWTATDAAGNTASCLQTVVVTDNEDPSITCPSNISQNADPGQCEADSVSVGTPTVTDNCPGASVGGVRSDALPLTDPYPVGTTTITWTATDAAGNTASCLQTVVVTDDEDPSITCPPDLDLNADPGVCLIRGVDLSTPRVSDNCTPVNVGGVRSDALPLTDPFPVGTTTVTWTATDAAGNTATCLQTVVVKDAEDPQITCAPDINESTDPGTCTADVEVGVATATDNCSVTDLQGVRSDALPLTDPYPVGTTTITWTATDAAGNSATCVQTVSITDINDLTIDCPGDITQAADPGQCSAAVTITPAGATDNCPGVQVNGVRSDALPLTDPYPVGTTTITWTATDAAGNTITCTQTVTIGDSEDPQIACPPDVNVSAQPGTCAAPSVNLGSPTATDNCPGVTSNGVRSDGLPLADPFPVGTTTVTWTATDTAGNSASCTQTVVVNDDEDPSITCPPDLDLNADPGVCLIRGVDLSTPRVSDNCTQVNVGGTRSDALPITDPFPVGTTTVTWTATDAAGNTATCLQTVVVKDAEDPQITCAPDINESTDPGTCTADVEVGVATATDNCSVTDLQGIRSDALPLTDPYPVGTTTITWTATDAAGNSATCVQTVSITDINDLTIDCPGDITQAADPGQCSAAVTITPAGATDNCPGVQVNGVRSDALPLTDPYPVGTTTITWTATDAAGNTATCAQTVTVTDNQDPRISCPPDVNVSAEPGSCLAPAVNLGSPVAADNCPGVTTDGVRSDGLPLADPFPVGTTTVTWTATDTAGNSASCTQTVVVNDSEDPSLVCPADIELVADPGLCLTTGVSLSPPQVSDNCTQVDVGGTRSDNQPLASEFPVGTTTITWTATDSEGNTMTCLQRVIVRDAEDPQITCQLDIEEGVVKGTCEGSVNMRQAIATDNCGVTDLQGVRSDGQPLANPYPVGTTTITWTATDAAGNSATCEQLVIIFDDQNPSITCAIDIYETVDKGQCSAEVKISPATATDNCGEPEVQGVRSDGLPLANPYPVGTTTITWTATDAAGNTASCPQLVIISDDQNPTIECPAAVNETNDPGECFASGVEIGNPNAADNCGVVNVAGVRSDAQPLPAPYPVGVTTITWTATDAAGNTATCLQTVTVVDVDPPRIACPPDVNASAQPGSCLAPTVNLGTPNVVDNCPGVVVTGVRSDGQPLAAPFAVGTTTVTWTATDGAGNTASCVQTVIVTDVQNPSLTCPADINLIADPGLCATTGVSLSPPQVSDNCTEVSVGGARSDNLPLADEFPVGTTLVTWTATDANNNTITCVQSVTVLDVEPPALSCPDDLELVTAPCEQTIEVPVSAPSTSDNCGVDEVAGVRSDNLPLAAPFAVGTTTITWTVTDVSGNVAMCEQVVMVEAGPCAPCPDLEGTLVSGLTRRCRYGYCTVSGSLMLTNIGNAPIPASTTQYFLSSDPVYNPGVDRRIGATIFSALNAGQSQTKSFKLSLPRGQTGSGMYILAFHDAFQCKVECDETNNIQVLGQLP